MYAVCLTMKDTADVGRMKLAKIHSRHFGAVVSYHASGPKPLYCINVITLDFCDI